MTFAFQPHDFFFFFSEIHYSFQQFHPPDINILLSLMTLFVVCFITINTIIMLLFFFVFINFAFEIMGSSTFYLPFWIYFLNNFSFFFGLLLLPLFLSSGPHSLSLGGWFLVLPRFLLLLLGFHVSCFTLGSIVGLLHCWPFFFFFFVFNYFSCWAFCERIV